MFKSRLFTIIVVVAAIAVASLLGVKAGDIVNSVRYKESRTKTTDAILNRMASIEVGAVMPDNRFEDLDRKDVQLSSLIHGRTAIIFFSPDCHNCLDELDHLQGAIDNVEDSRHFVLISPEDRLELIQARDDYNVQCTILWDRDSRYARSLKIDAEPFNVIVGDSLRIEQIVAGPMTVDELRSVVAENK